MKKNIRNIILPAILSIGSLFFYGTSDEIFQETCGNLLSCQLIKQIILDADNELGDNQECHLFYSKVTGANNLYLVYKNKWDQRAIDDKFFIHLYVKNRKEPQAFINKDRYVKEHWLIENGEEKYLVFIVSLDSLDVQLSQVEKFNVGRYIPGKDRSCSFESILVDEVLKKGKQLQGNLPELNISISKESFEKIEKARNIALQVGLIPQESKKYVNAQVSYNNGKQLESKIRLKGDWLDHLKDSLKWSFRIKISGDEAVEGMNKFSVQHPKSRNYLWELFAFHFCSQYGLKTPKYNFAKVTLTIHDEIQKVSRDLGIMAVEEAFGENMLARLGIEEGFILGYDEAELWLNRYYELNPEKRKQDGMMEKNLLIYKYKVKSYVKPKNFSEIQKGKYLDLEKYLIDCKATRKQFSEKFDLEKMSKFVFCSNLLGAHHGLIWHNLRFAYQHDKLEPIAFDMNAGQKIKEFWHYYKTHQDTAYFNAFSKVYEQVMQPEQIAENWYYAYKKTEIYQEVLNQEYKVPFNVQNMMGNYHFMHNAMYQNNWIAIEKQEELKDSVLWKLTNTSPWFLEVKNQTTEKRKLFPYDSLFVNKTWISSKDTNKAKKEVGTIEVSCIGSTNLPAQKMDLNF